LPPTVEWVDLDNQKGGLSGLTPPGAEAVVEDWLAADPANATVEFRHGPAPLTATGR
jgi:hypothetical protein